MCRCDASVSSGTMPRMLGMRGLPPNDPQGLSPEVAALIAQLQQQVQDQAQQLSERKQALAESDRVLAERDKSLAERDKTLAERDALLQRKDREIALREAKIEKINFELARLKRWTYGAKSEAMSADQRRLFEETLAEDEASLREQLDRLRREAEAAAAAAGTKPKAPVRKPRRNALPQHLRRVEHHHEPESTDCQELECGRPMTRIGEDVTERLDIVPAEFFVHRHIYGKWTCRHCQVLKQAPSVPEIVEGGVAASGLLAHTLISRFVDHLPYYRQETCWRRSKFDPPCRLNFDPGLGAGVA
ncbi:MAG: hypothetical protein EKK53_06710 [Burkholderiales bacterium]|nr:MAG: hypothetical protein EKK53_06710 [Burkholderiales bacterium]